MIWRSLAIVLAAIVCARWLHRTGQDVLPASTQDFPEPVQAFLQLHNLTERLDDLAALLKKPNSSDASRPSQEPGAPTKKKHPVVIVPGLTSCGLEVWKAHPCLGDSFFRNRIWGEVSMAQAILNNWTCWLLHISPDPITGIDREGVKVRPAKGLRSADYFLPGFWLWGKLISNLADLGYDEDDILLECYDWRIAFPLLETRDRYLSNLRSDIERVVDRSGEKAVVLGHSMGATLFVYFMNWVERESPGWCDKHLDSFVSIAGALLGAMGPLAAVISGEMDATAALGPFSSYIEALALTYDQMREIYWSMGGLGSLLPMGGSPVWGSSATGWTDTPVDVVDFDTGDEGRSASLEDIYAMAEDPNSKLPLKQYPFYTSFERRILNPNGDAGSDGAPVPGPDDPRRFGNPLASALPQAPNMRIFCMYGSGMPTERAYRYGLRQVRWRFSENDLKPEGLVMLWSKMKSVDATVAEMESYNTESNAKRHVKVDTWPKALAFSSLDSAISALRELIAEGPKLPEQWLRIDTEYHSNESDDPWDNGAEDGMYSYGVAKSDGDYTVPLVSLGYMCASGWRDIPEFNPSGVRVFTKELKHDPTPIYSDPRGGPATAKHVDIIGNHEFLMDILHLVSGNSSHLEQDQIVSNITEISKVITPRVQRALGRQ